MLRMYPCKAALLVWTLIGLTGCSGDSGSPEAEIRSLVARAQTAAEAREMRDLRALIADDYADDRGLDRKAVENLIRLHVLRNQSIHLFTRVRDIAFLEPGRATVRVTAAMAGRPVTSAGDLAGVNADLYRFDLTLIRRDGTWQVQGARWEPARLDDFW